MVTNSKVDKREIVFFDGVCNLCSSTVNIILKHENNSHLYFSSLQSKFAKKFLNSYGINSNQHDSIIYYSKNNLYYKSDAIFKILMHSKFYFKLMLILKIFPKVFLDYCYDLISRNRYKWFGKYESCLIPDDEIKSKFI